MAQLPPEHFQGHQTLPPASPARVREGLGAGAAPAPCLPWEGNAAPGKGRFVRTGTLGKSRSVVTNLCRHSQGHSGQAEGDSPSWPWDVGLAGLVPPPLLAWQDSPRLPFSPSAFGEEAENMSLWPGPGKEGLGCARGDPRAGGPCRGVPAFSPDPTGSSGSGGRELPWKFLTKLGNLG